MKTIITTIIIATLVALAIALVIALLHRGNKRRPIDPMTLTLLIKECYRNNETMTFDEIEHCSDNDVPITVECSAVEENKELLELIV